MPTENTSVTSYFDTPERVERLQLVVHLLRNAEDVPYLRAPEGAGKTRFAQRLLEGVPQEFSIVWLNAQAGTSIDAALYDQMGLDEGETVWPNDILSAVGDKALLLVIDDADALDLESLGKLFELHGLGARLLFLGNGGLAQLQGDWDLQFVDLPAFTEEQTLGFLAASGYVASGQINESMAIGLHRAAAGLPGHLIAALSALPIQGAVAAPSPSPSRSKSISPLLISVALVCALIVGLGWFFQDEINAVFKMPEVAVEQELPVKSVSKKPRPQLESVAEEGEEVVASDKNAIKSIGRSEIEPQLAEISSVGPVSDMVGSVAGIDEKLSPVVESDVAAQPKVTEPEEMMGSKINGAVKGEPVEKGADAVFDAVVEAAIAAAAQEPVVEKATLEEQIQPVQAAVVERAVVQSVEQARSEPTVEAVKTPAKLPAKAKKSPDADVVWLAAQTPGNYTLQLVGARDKASIRKFIEIHKIAKPYAVFVRDLNGKPWYSLVAGVYLNRDAAVAARSRFKSPLSGSGVWPRTFASIQEGFTSN